MSIPHYAEHLLSFLAPALVVALLVALGAPLVLPRPSWWAIVAINFLAGAVVLGAGLWLFGHDGKMATYVALVLAVGSCQWLVGRGWRS